jgi:hypothetical protein
MPALQLPLERRGPVMKPTHAVPSMTEAGTREVGYTWEAIAAKATSLQGVLVRLSAPEGWCVEEVTRYLGFASYYVLPR